MVIILVAAVLAVVAIISMRAVTCQVNNLVSKKTSRLHHHSMSQSAVVIEIEVEVQSPEDLPQGDLVMLDHLMKNEMLT